MNILIISPIDETAIRRLEEDHTVRCMFAHDKLEMEAMRSEAEVLVFRSGVNITRELLNCAPRLKLLVRAGCGLDNIDMGCVEQRGLQLVRIPQPGAKAVAEMAFALMLALSRNLLRADRHLREGHWAKYELDGYLLTGKTLGIVGAGQIGSLVGRLGFAWGMTVIGCVEEEPVCDATVRAYAEQGMRLTTLDEVLSTSDFISIHVPLQESTRYLLNERRLAQVKPGAFLVNLARGGVVDEQALFRALSDGGPLRGAALDVHEREGEGMQSPLAALPNVVLTPHMGATTVDTQSEIGRAVVEVISEYEASNCRNTAACLARS